MKKVVYNACYGGFGLSLEALYALLMLGFPLRATSLEESGYKVADFPQQAPNGVRAHERHGVLLKDDVIYQAELSHFDLEEAALRSHPILVMVVEKLGKKASSQYADLQIQEIGDDDLYAIEEYDGNESVRILDRANYTAGFLMNALEVPEFSFAPLLPSKEHGN